MALQPQKVVFPMAQGMDTKTDKKQLVTGKMELLQNVTLSSPLQFQKRLGYEALASIENPREVFSFQDEAVVFADNKVYTYSPGLDSLVSIKLSTSPTTELEYEPVRIDTYEAISNSLSHSSSSSAYHSFGVQAFVSNAGTNLYFTIIDYETKANLYGPVPFGGTVVTAPKVYVIQNTFIVLYNDSTTLYYRAIPVNTTSGAMPSAVAIATNFDTSNPAYDACVLSDVVYIGWAIGSNGIGVAKIDSSLTVYTSALPVAVTVSSALGLSVNTASTISIASASTTVLYYLVMDTNFNVTVPLVTVETISDVYTACPIVTSGNGYIYYEVVGSNPGSGLFFNNLVKRAIITSNALTSTAVLIRSVGIVSKPFTVTVNDEDIICIWVGYTGAQPAPGQGTQFLINQSANVIAKLFPGNCFGIGPKTSGDSVAPLNSPAEVVEISDGVFNCSFLRATFFFNVSATQQISGYGVFGVNVDFTENARSSSAVEANNLHVASGILSVYDGKDFVEHNYNVFQEKIVSVSGSGTGAIFTNSDVYQYVVVPEWVDAQGNLHQGAPGPVYSFTAGAAYSSIGFGIPTNRITQKNNLYLSPFRTEGNGSIFYRVASTVSGGGLNSTSANTVAFTDTTADSTLITHDQLYTTGGVVANEAVPSPLFIGNYNGRLMVIPSETRNVAWISKSVSQGIPNYAVDFSSFLQLQIGSKGGDCTAFVQMDDKGVFTRDAFLSYITGFGPNDTLTSTDIGPPIEIPTDVGCTNPSSIVSAPFGVLFKSEKGIYLLERSLATNYIGAEVEAYNSDTIVSAELIPDTQQVRFLLDTGTALVFDYLVKQWFIHESVSGVGATIYQGLYTYLGSNGALLQETPDSYSDAGEFYSMKLVTGWLSFAGIQGFKRVWKMLLLGTYKGSHRLQVSFAFDFNPNPVQTILINTDDIFTATAYGEGSPYGSDETYGGGEFSLENFEFDPIIQKCQSIQVTIEDISNGGTNETLAISSLAFQVGIEPGVNRLPASKKFG